LAGVIHVMSGADHLIAMAPSSITNPKGALRNALSWGLGHSSGVILLSFLAIFIKDFTKLSRFSNFAEFLVGISLLIIGIIAIKKSFGLSIHSHTHKHSDGSAHEHLHFHGLENTKHLKHSHALTSLGFLHGVAGGSHFLAVLPALALPIFQAVAYLISYLFGSLIIMNLFTFLISYSTLRAGQKFVRKLFSFAGFLSLSMGVFWLQKSTSIFIR